MRSWGNRCIKHVLPLQPPNPQSRHRTLKRHTMARQADAPLLSKARLQPASFTSALPFEYQPIRVLISVLLTPADCTRISTSFSPTTGTGMSSLYSTLSGPPGPVSLNAHMRLETSAMMQFPQSNWCWNAAADVRAGHGRASASRTGAAGIGTIFHTAITLFLYEVIP